MSVAGGNSDPPIRAQRIRGVAGESDRRRTYSQPVAEDGVPTGDSIVRSERRRRPPPRTTMRHFLIGSQWVYMAPAMVLGTALGALVSVSVPFLLPLLLIALGVVAAGATPLLVRLERRPGRTALQRHALMRVGVTLPMLLFGFGISLWAAAPAGLGWAAAAGLLAVMGMVASILQQGRLPATIAAQIAVWAGAAFVSGSQAGYFVLAIGGIAGVLVGVRHDRLARGEDERLREIERSQLRAEDILRDYEQTGQGWFWETDRRGLLTYVSAPIGVLLQRQSQDLLGRPLAELFILDDPEEQGERTLNFHLTARSSFQDLAVRAATREEERWWSINGRPIHDEFNNFIGFRGSGSDLTEKRRSQERATRLARYDSLTGLANRFQMSETLEKILGARREDQRNCAVFLLDLDRFKHVNDTMGHPAGDALLKQVAQRLERTVDNAGRVGRLGGDEFQVILPGRLPRPHLAELAARIIETLSQPYSIDGSRCIIGASVGIALAPDDGVTSEALIRNADLALYAAKDGGRGRHHFYAADLHSDAEERRQLEQDLRDAIAHGGLELHYQPVVRTATETITGFEALLRWKHPRHGMLSPARFVPIAEDAGLIAPIGEWALRTACRDLAAWPESVRVAVNVSPLQFANPALPAIVSGALAAAQVEASRLELEITESVFLNDDSATDAMFAALKALGVRLALDDFGTGYSSLGYLRSAPFDKIKIDQSFVRGATVQGSRNGAIIASIVSLAEALGMETTAEGVETMDELDLVRLLGCSHVQGYIYEKALTADAVNRRLEAGLGAVACGPRSSRARRQTMLRKVTLEHGGERYLGTIRNISTTGALVEGLWNVPQGTVFSIGLAEGYVVSATCRWCREDRMGMEFAAPLELDAQGRIQLAAPAGVRLREPAGLRRTA